MLVQQGAIGAPGLLNPGQRRGTPLQVLTDDDDFDLVLMCFVE